METTGFCFQEKKEKALSGIKTTSGSKAKILIFKALSLLSSGLSHWEHLDSGKDYYSFAYVKYFFCDTLSLKASVTSVFIIGAD